MLHGFGIAGFRSFGPDPQFIAPLGRINLLVGQNNVGKSNVLRGLRILASSARPGQSAPSDFDPSIDSHQGRRGAQLAFWLPVSTVPDQLGAYLQSIGPKALPGDAKFFQMARQIALALPSTHGDAVWFCQHPSSSEIAIPAFDRKEIRRDPHTGEPSYFGVRAPIWSAVWGKLKNATGGDFTDFVPSVLAWLSPFGKISIPDIHAVEAFRQIGPAHSKYEGLNGQGLINRLVQLQTPRRRDQSDRGKFDQINEFLRQVTGSADASLNVPHSADELNVSMNNRLLPIQSLGTGIHEVVILAAAATAFDNMILCLEEPEVHLHPRLQRRLLAYLRDHTTNQYFITTHSAHLLDAHGIERFHVQLNEHGETTVQHLSAPGGRASVCFDLGYRPSDLVQANCIVWVEGPSDRIYVNAWISALDATLVEGEHYSVMFYGGKLLSHLELSDSVVNEFIELQRLNRRVAILMDSDKSAPEAELGATKERVRAQTVQHGGHAWITAGREVENYIARGTLQRILADVHPQTKFAKCVDQWGCAYRTSGGKRDVADKVRIAREAVKQVELDILDLKSQVESLCEFIRASNT